MNMPEPMSFSYSLIDKCEIEVRKEMIRIKQDWALWKT